MAYNRRYLMPLAIAVFALSAIGIGALLIVSNARQTQEAIGVELRAIASHAASHIEPSGYYRLFFQNDRLKSDFKAIEKSSEFLAFKSQLKNTTAFYSDLALGEENIYTFVRDLKSDEIKWGVMLHPKPFSGEGYAAPEALNLVVAYGKPGFSGIYLSTASKREWISGYAPIVYRSQVIGVVEVAREITEVQRAARMRLMPALIASLAVILLSVAAVLLLLNAARKTTKANAELKATLQELEKSTSTYRTLTESSTDIVFLLDPQFRVASINTAVRRQLGFSPAEAQGMHIVDVLCQKDKADAPDYLFDPQLLHAALAALRDTNEKVNLSAALKSALTGDAKQYRILIEKVAAGGENSAAGYIGRAVATSEMAVASIIERSRFSFRLTNSLLLTEELATFLAAIARSYVDESQATTLRIMLREMLLNAIEHGNLEIDFDTKTTSLMHESYFQLIDERRRQPPYRDRSVLVDALISADKLAFRITDEGQGFNHREMLEKLTREKNETAHGRGIVMTLQEFDIVRYNQKGNSVVLIKNLAVS
ncbi:ATP-binding protein [Turneriella parva]|uniref:PAS fold-4 domain protein n=1 Tax=Turneriella parva (strain ATCC BAA-1111 / DSM 21527 / NCTC 11395 / H) TaxID=869212 RepID=I4B6P6_TURPD|nr:ATP-binding protein [Turneriella parva]AFM12953.1 PAS fold-4 domain protein [Turneriella parva DSM 21527]